MSCPASQFLGLLLLLLLGAAAVGGSAAAAAAWWSAAAAAAARLPARLDFVQPLWPQIASSDALCS